MELLSKYNALPLQKRVERRILQEEIERARGDLREEEAKLERLLVRSPAAGRFFLLDDHNLPGRFVQQGEMLGYIVTESRPTIRVVVGQADIALIRERVTDVAVRLAGAPERPLAATIDRIVPAAILDLPSAVLGTAGGGAIPVDPADPEGMRALESHFQLDLGLGEKVKHLHIGERVHVRFEHGVMPLALQWYRGLRQLFLRKFYV
jgi:putative peptide zinc metalloprotease protein